MLFRSQICLIVLLLLSRPAQAVSVLSDLITGVVQSHGGSTSRSLTGSQSFGVSLRHFSGSGTFQLIAGGSFYLSPSTQAVVNQNLYLADVYGGEFVFGGALLPFFDATLRPVLFTNLLVGAALARMGAPPATIDPTTLGMTYGAQVCFGMQYVWGKSALHFGVAYTLRRATRLLGQSGFELDAMTFELGLAF